MSFRLKFSAILLPFLALSGPAFGQSFIRTTQTTDLMCGYTANSGSGAPCGEPSITWAAASSGACSPIQAQDSRCPVAEYHRGKGAHCGVASFKNGTGFQCGSDPHEFWSDWGDSCPDTTLFNGTVGVVSIGSIDTEVRIHRSGFKVTTQTRHKCRGQMPKSCRHQDFGVEAYNECNLGPKSFQVCTVGYETCRHPNHGEEARSYPTCQHEAFGTTPNTCTIPDLVAQKEEIERFSNELTSYLLAIEGVKSTAVPILPTLTAARTMLEVTLSYLLENEAETAAEIIVNSTDALQDKLVETRSSIISVKDTIEKIRTCETGSDVCDLSGSTVTSLLEIQVSRIRANLVLIRQFLINEDSRWAGAAESFRTQIREILESPQMKSLT